MKACVPLEAMGCSFSSRRYLVKDITVLPSICWIDVFISVCFSWRIICCGAWATRLYLRTCWSMSMSGRPMMAWAPTIPPGPLGSGMPTPIQPVPSKVMVALNVPRVPSPTPGSGSITIYSKESLLSMVTNEGRIVVGDGVGTAMGAKGSTTQSTRVMSKPPSIRSCSVRFRSEFTCAMNRSPNSASSSVDAASLVRSDVHSIRYTSVTSPLMCTVCDITSQLAVTKTPLE
mmetsp:Transcript_32734/g.66867  ORF Transcript_32734/g.66867 Transcript_32734/m.66867 type:complete len:231 (-) Transcript_32734:1544-2236(-)